MKTLRMEIIRCLFGVKHEFGFLILASPLGKLDSGQKCLVANNLVTVEAMEGQKTTILTPLTPLRTCHVREYLRDWNLKEHISSSKRW